MFHQFVGQKGFWLTPPILFPEGGKLGGGQRSGMRSTTGLGSLFVEEKRSFLHLLGKTEKDQISCWNLQIPIGTRRREKEKKRAGS